MTTLSVSIVTYEVNQILFAEVIEALAVSIDDARERSLLNEIKLVVVDNGDDTAFLKKLVARFSDRFTGIVIDNPTNTGFASGHNMALAECESDIHLILNPDAVLAQDALSVACAYLRQHEEAVMLSPYAESPDGNQAYLCKRYPTVLDLFIRGFFPASLQRFVAARLARYECRDFGTEGAMQGVSIVSGCCMLIRTGSLKEINGFNEDYFLYFEDFDLSLKIAKKGSIDFLPDMRIVHHGGAASKKGLRHIGMFCKSAFTFFMANGWKLV